ncbi:YjfK family protein [Vibrio parahaemolyticus]
MLKKVCLALSAVFSNKKPVEQPKPMTPEIGGFRLGGVFEIDSLMLRLAEPELTIEGAATSQIIEAVGVIDMGDGTRLVRYYTDDEGYIQVLINGDDDSGIEEISLWYFYDSQPIDGQQAWDNLLNNEIVKQAYDLEGTTFAPYWENDKPVCLTEKVYNKSGFVKELDSFNMLYSRNLQDDKAEDLLLPDGKTEELLIAGEERFINNNPDRLISRVTGIQLKISDFKVVA